jgi:hypothetical protein
MPALPITELRALFTQVFDRPPLIANRRFLERRLAYHWQAERYEAAYPGVLATQRARIAALAAAVEAASNCRRQGVAALAPGTVLIRAFGGVEHEVKVLAPDAFDYAGKRYGSLSQVARVITGTRWSGPTFFGLRQPRRGKGK